MPSKTTVWMLMSAAALTFLVLAGLYMAYRATRP